MGDFAAAEQDYKEAGTAGFAGTERLRTRSLLQPKGRFDSDYPGTLAIIDSLDALSWQRDWAAGLVRFRRGDFPETVSLLGRLAPLSLDPEIGKSLRWAKEWGEYWGQELALQKRDAEKNDLPRLRITTSEGPVVVELFEGDAPNTVKDFVWLAEAHAYDGLAFEVPERFRRVTSGEPPESAARWAIRTEVTKRKPFRGMVAMANKGVDTEWARFFFVTGTLPEVDGHVTVFGRVLEGQGVVDRLISTDKIEKVEIVRKRPNVEYRPITVAGTLAPPPK